MTTRPWFALLGALVLALAAACGGATGDPSTEERAAAPFTRISVDGALDVTVRQKSGAPERIEVTAPDGGHERVVTEVIDGAIHASIDGKLVPGTSLLLVVADLESVAATNGAAVTLEGELELPVFAGRAAAGASIVATEVSNLASGGVWRLAAGGGSTIDLVTVVASAVTVEVTEDSTIALEAITSVLGAVESGSTLSVEGDPSRLEVTGSGVVRAIGDRDRPASTPTTEAEVTGRADGLTGAPLPPPDTLVVAFDEDRFNASAGTFPALTDPAVVPAAVATWLDDDTLVLGAVQNGEARAYPIYMMRLHHVANDVLGGKPYLVTF